MDGWMGSQWKAWAVPWVTSLVQQWENKNNRRRGLAHRKGNRPISVFLKSVFCESRQKKTIQKCMKCKSANVSVHVGLSSVQNQACRLVNHTHRPLTQVHPLTHQELDYTHTKSINGSHRGKKSNQHRKTWSQNKCWGSHCTCKLEIRPLVQGDSKKKIFFK